MCLMYPKPKRKRKRKKHPPSIIPGQKGICLLCARLYGDYTEKYTELHHVFYGRGRRAVSDREGFTCYLCREHHREGPESIHGSTDRKNRTYLCGIFQEEYEKTHTRQEFMELIGENYLDQE